MRTVLFFVASLSGSAAFQLSVALYPSKLQPYAFLVKWIWIACAVIWLIWLFTHPRILKGNKEGFKLDEPNPVQNENNLTANPNQSVIQNFNFSGISAESAKSHISFENNPKPKPNVCFILAKASFVDYDDYSGGYREGDQGRQRAFILSFRNKSIPNLRVSIPGDVRAHVLYRDDLNEEVCDAPAGYWLEDQSDVTNFDLQTTKSVLVAVERGVGGWAIPWMERRPSHWGDSVDLNYRSMTDSIKTLEVVLVNSYGFSSTMEKFSVDLVNHKITHL